MTPLGVGSNTLWSLLLNYCLYCAILAYSAQLDCVLHRRDNKAHNAWCIKLTMHVAIPCKSA